MVNKMENSKKETLKTKTKTADKKKPDHFKWFFGFWGVVLVLVIIGIAAFKLSPIALLIWFIAMALSFIIMMAQLMQNWEGIVEEIKIISEKRRDGDDDWRTENVTYAFIRLTDGKLKKVRSGGWKKGDHLKKEKWEYGVKVL